MGITQYSDWKYARIPYEFRQLMYLNSNPKIANYSLSHTAVDDKEAQSILLTLPRISDGRDMLIRLSPEI